MSILTGLRPMTDAEREAAALYLQKEPVGDICMRTGLTRAQVAAAVDLSKAWAQQAAAAVAASVPRPRRREPLPVIPAGLEGATFKEVFGAIEESPETEPTAEADPTPAAETSAEPVIAVDLGAVDEPAPPSTEELLARAEASPQQRVRTVAAAIRTQLAHLATLMDNDERVRTLTTTIEVQREQLAKAERELAELLGDAGAAPDTRKAVDWDAALADSPDEQPPTQEPTDDELRRSPVVRAWAKAEGWEVGDRGLLKLSIATAYRNAKLSGGAS